MNLNLPKIKVPVLQNRVFDSNESAKNSDYGYMEIRKNNNTGIYENGLFDESKLIYDSNYDNEQSNSQTFQRHLNEVMSILSPFMIDKRVIEIGCGKGKFLEMLLAEGFDAFGCDPTYTGSNDRVIKSFFSKEINLIGDVIILRHVLEHIKDPIKFINQIAEVNNYKGLIYIEVPDLNWIINNLAFFDFFYEHVNYFTPSDFEKVFLKIIKKGLFFGDQYQFILADLSSLQLPPYKDDSITDFEQILFVPPDQLIDHLLSSQKPIYIWGAASKGVILTLHLQSKGIVIQNLIDINPNKQNKFTALSAIEIISPDTFIDIGSNSNLIIVNPNYEQEIREITKLVNNISYIVL